MIPYYGWDATASRLEPLLEKALKAPLSHFKFEQTFAFFAFDFFDLLKVQLFTEINNNDL